MKRRKLFNLFQVNTGKNKIIAKPYAPSFDNPYGHQRSRVMKFSFQRRDE